MEKWRIYPENHDRTHNLAMNLDAPSQINLVAASPVRHPRVAEMHFPAAIIELRAAPGNPWFRPFLHMIYPKQRLAYCVVARKRATPCFAATKGYEGNAFAEMRDSARKSFFPNYTLPKLASFRQTTQRPCGRHHRRRISVAHPGRLMVFLFVSILPEI